MAAKSNSSTSKTRGKKSTTIKNTRKNTSRKKQGNAKKSTKTTAKNKTAKDEAESLGFLGSEIFIWMVVALSILMILSNFGLGGFIGEAISGFLIKIFGILAYVFPFVLFLSIMFLVANKGSKRARIRVATAFVMLVLICTLVQLINEEGGALGGLLVNLLTPAIGVAGTYVIVIILLIICLVIITGKSALKGMQKGGNRAYEKAKKDAIRRKELSETRRLEREKLLAEQEKAEKEEQGEGTSYDLKPKGKKRRDNIVDGVSFDTTLGSKKKKFNMHELTIESPDAADKPKLGTENLSSPFEPIARSIEEVVSEPVVEEERKVPSFTIYRGGETVESADDLASEPAISEVQDSKSQTAESKELEIQEAQEDQEVKRSQRKAPKMDAASAAGEMAEVEAAITASENLPKKEYEYPSLNLLKKGKNSSGESNEALAETATKLQNTLASFGVKVTISNVSCGPSVTRYELQPETGVKVSKIVGLADDIKLNLAAADIRIEAPIPGKAAVGIEVPNKETSGVMLRDLLESKEFQDSKSKLSFAVGKDIGGKTVVFDIAKMPHVLIAGATGSGKSVCINTLIMSILYKATPDEVKLIMIDPKVVELNIYNGIPHLLIPVVTDPKKAAGALNWGVAEMTRRYKAFAEYGVRDMAGYNEKIKKEHVMTEEGDPLEPLPQIVIIVDELADLMMVAPGDVEDAICRLAQLARAAGIHLVIATQRPSVNVITGLIKANMPSRIAFSVSSGVDSRTIIDMNGAEKLLGKGDMLFYPTGYQKPARVQGSFVSDEEIQQVVDFLKDSNQDNVYNEEVINHVDTIQLGGGSTPMASSDDDSRDTYFKEAGQLIIDKEKASIGMLQRNFKIGFNRAARIMDQLCEAGVVGPEEGTKPRKVLMNALEFEEFISKQC